MQILSDPLHMDTMPVSDLQCFSRQSPLPRVKCLTSRLECSLLMLPNHQSLERWAFFTTHKDGDAGFGLSPGLKVTIFERMAPSTRRFCALKWKLFDSQCRNRNLDPVYCPAGSMLEFLKELFCLPFYVWDKTFLLCLCSFLELSVVLEGFTTLGLNSWSQSLRGF